MKALVGALVLVMWCSAAAAEAAAFDLGGPCDSGGPSGTYPGKIIAAEKAGDWSRAADYAKQSLRGMCRNSFRWLVLADIYVGAGDAANAAAVLAEMDRRGLEIDPSQVRLKERLAKFLDSDAFRTTEFGRVLARRMQALAERRAAYRHRLAALPRSERPPATFVAEGACPFECCAFREWTVKADVTLLHRPLGTTTVGTAKAGETVQAETGEVHVEPVPIGVAHDFGIFKKGDVFFVLNYLGEGFYDFWHNGRVVGGGELDRASHCLRPGESCRTETVFPEHEELLARRHEWWVRVRTKSGIVGWTSDTLQFGNMDACG